MRVSAITSSDRGIRLAALLSEKAGGRISVCRCDKKELPLWTQREGTKAEALLLICEMEDAVRAASLLFEKDILPPVIVQIDELAKYVVPLCPASSRTAAAISKEIAGLLGSIPVVRGPEQIETFAIDKWASSVGLRIANPAAIRYVKEKLLCGEPGLYDSVFPISGALPPGIQEAEDWEKRDFSVSYLTCADPHTLLLVPPVLSLGIHAEAEADEETLESAAAEFLKKHCCHPLALGAVCCLESCPARNAIAAFCEKFHLPFQLVGEAALTNGADLFTQNDAESDCEKCAVLGMGGQPLVKYFEQNGIGFALAVLDPEMQA